MNPFALLAAARNRRRGEVDPTARLMPGALLVNNLGRRDAIAVGPHSIVKGELLVFGHGGRVRVGSHCFVGEHTRVWSAREILIGDRVLLSHQVNVFDSLTHPLRAADRHAQFLAILGGRHPQRIDLAEAPVRIEDDAWVGCQSVILAGVTIGRGAVVGAGSVVTRDVPPFCIAAGNPAVVIRELAADER